MITVNVNNEDYMSEFDNYYEFETRKELDDLIEELESWYGFAFVDVDEEGNKVEITIEQDTREFYDKYGDGRIFMKDGDEEIYIGQ